LKESDLPQSKPTRQQAVDQLLSELPTMDRKGLVRLWRTLFDREPSPALRRETLIPILAFRIQVKAFGGLKESTARKLRALADDAGSSSIHQREPLGQKPVHSMCVSTTESCTR